MRPWIICGIVALGLAVGASCLDGWGEGRRACRSLQSWWVWGDNPPPPNSDCVALRVPLEGEAGGTISGTLIYRNGRQGWTEASGLPMRAVHVDFGGISMTIEDARWWRPSSSVDFLRPRGPTLIASITCASPMQPSRTLAHSIHAFGREEDVELALPFEIAISKADGGERGALSYDARLGEIGVTGQQIWDEKHGKLAPMIRRDTAASVSAAVVHGLAGQCYGEVELVRNGAPVSVADCRADRGTWRLSGEDGRLRCVALVTGELACGGAAMLRGSGQAM